MKKHKHHIIPKHAGGTDDTSNIITLTIPEHAEAHRLLYEQHGRWQDRVAWLSLAGIMKDEERIYEILKNSNPGGYKHTDEAKLKISESRRGERNPMYGKPSPTRGVKRPGIGGRKKGTTWSDEERKKHKLIRSQPGYFEYTRNPERCRKISEAQKGRPGTATGKIWYNNGINEHYSFECPVGYTKGRLKRPLESKRGMFWYNNGEFNRQFRDGEQPEGFSRGRISKK
jgi:hypothetical protein